MKTNNRPTVVLAIRNDGVAVCEFYAPSTPTLCGGSFAQAVIQRGRVKMTRYLASKPVMPKRKVMALVRDLASWLSAYKPTSGVNSKFAILSIPAHAALKQIADAYETDSVEVSML